MTSEESAVAFRNRVRSLFNINGGLLPELTPEHQLEFVRDPARYYINTSYEEAKAIWREVQRRQPAMTEPDRTPIARIIDIIRLGVDCDWSNEEIATAILRELT